MKERLDILLVNKNLVSSRQKAKAIIMAGNVFVNGQKETKAGTSFDEGVSIEIKGKPLKYVSRGGFKLEKALEEFDIELDNKICMDVGSSTGGFTDCMLQSGAQKVYAVDVGTNQLVWQLRQDERVVVMEKTNIRYMEAEDISDLIDFSSIDVSFISLELVLTPVRNVLKSGGQLVCLIKPQFEAGRDQVGKKGVVRDHEVHIQVIEKVIIHSISLGFRILNLDFSPITGPAGNIEYLLHLVKDEADSTSNKIDTIEEGQKSVDNDNISNLAEYINQVVVSSHRALDL